MDWMNLGGEEEELLVRWRCASKSKPKNGPSNLSSVEPCRLHQNNHGNRTEHMENRTVKLWNK